MAKPETIHTVQSLLQRTVEEGDCVLWLGYSANRTPLVYSEGVMKSVRSLLSGLLGKTTTGKGYWSVHCGNHLCIHPEHMVFRLDHQHMAHMARMLNASPALNAIRSAKISKSKKRITHDQLNDIMTSRDSCADVAKRLGLSKSMVSRYRRSEAGANMANNMWAGLMK